MKKSLVILLAASISLAACKNEKKGPGGLLYTIYKSEGKEKIKEGDFVKVDFIQTNDKDSIVYSTYDANNPQIFPVGKKVYAGDMNDVLFLFGEGDSVQFKINIDTNIKHTGQPRPEQLKDDKYMTYTVKIHKVLTKKDKEADSTFQKRANDFFQADYKATMDKRKISEDAKIKKYISDNNLKVKTTPSGLNYVITEPGTGAKPALGDTVMVDYTGKFTSKKSDGNDNVFDTSIESVFKKTMRPNPQATFGPRPLVVGEGIVKGFAEGIQLIGKGGKMTLIFPSKLGWGPQGSGPIAPYSPVVFDIELKDIKKPAPNLVITPLSLEPVTKK
jgi:FKBP-type peptidyl-prolyl cis-trans isomerase